MRSNATNGASTSWAVRVPPGPHLVTQHVLSSSAQNGFTAIHSYGADTIVKRITVGAPYGACMVPAHSLPYDCPGVSRSLRLELDVIPRRSRGQAVSRMGGYCFYVSHICLWQRREKKTASAKTIKWHRC